MQTSSSSVVFVTQGQVTLETDRPWLRVKHLHTAVLECCYRTNEQVKISWVVRVTNSNRTTVPRNAVNASELVTFGDKITSPTRCGTLTLISVQYSDSGLYQCVLNGGIETPGTYLQVYSECLSCLFGGKSCLLYKPATNGGICIIGEWSQMSSKYC